VALVASEWVNPTERDRTFEALFQAEYARVVAIAQRVLGDGHAAEDVAQDVFYQFYRLHRPDVQYARPWLYRAAAHAALNVIRGNKRRFRRESAVAVEGSRMAVLRGGEEDPMHAVERAEGARELREAMGRLSEKYASVLALRYSGLSYAEVAGALGVGIGQVGTLLRRAEEALRKEMTRETSI
jgi:RNA polymerase sigma factor (sigma-70 family)